MIPQHLQDMILSDERWFNSLKDNSILGALTIAQNNVMVCLKVVAAACLLGVGGILLLIYNGFHFGSIAGYANDHSFSPQLFDFVAAHGPLELSMIVASAFCGLMFGRVFFRWRANNFKERLRSGAKDAFTLLMGVLPWILLAALIEGFISPRDFLSYQQKLFLGWSLACLFWVWTLFPGKTSQDNND